MRTRLPLCKGGVGCRPADVQEAVESGVRAADLAPEFSACSLHNCSPSLSFLHHNMGFGLIHSDEGLSGGLQNVCSLALSLVHKNIDSND